MFVKRKYKISINTLRFDYTVALLNLVSTEEALLL